MNALIRDISPEDDMFVAGSEHAHWSAEHYFAVGRSALKSVILSLEAAHKDPTEIRQILDLPCGHGRVLRHLRASFPQAEITACDLNHSGVDFCAATFDAVPVYSRENPKEIPLRANQFDLIWVGSLLTHLDRPLWHDFLRFFGDLLSSGGLLIFTTQGRQACREIRMDEALWCELPKSAIARVMNDYERTGFGYADYVAANCYGIALSRPDWVVRQLLDHGSLRLVHLCETGWADHQDVFACVRTQDPSLASRKG